MKKIIFTLCIILLFQCSSDDSTSETPYSDINVDYVYPENNADTIPINHQFLIYFDQSINPDEVRKKVILTTETDGKTQQIWYNVERYLDLITHKTLSAYKVCVIKPSNLLEPNKQYTLTINEGLLSTEHGKLKEALTYSFTTATAQKNIPDQGIYDGKDLEFYSDIAQEYNKDFIKLWYEEHLNPYYINKKSILLEELEDISIEIESISYNPFDKCIVIYPKDSLSVGHDYRIRLARFTDEIYDLGGNEYPGGGDLYFTLE